MNISENSSEKEKRVAEVFEGEKINRINPNTKIEPDKYVPNFKIELM